MTNKFILRGLRQIVRYSGDFLKDLTARREAKKKRARKALGINTNSDSKIRLLQLFAIYFLGEKIDNTYDDEWIDDEKPEYEETMKHLCRLYGRYSNRNGRKLI